MTVAVSREATAGIESRQQINYWRAQHARAAERASRWQQRAGQAEQRCREQVAQIGQLEQENQQLRARVAWLEKQVFGRKSERGAGPASGRSEEEHPEQRQQSSCEAGEDDGSSSVRRRGKQPGAKGHGRKRREQLPTEQVVHDLVGPARCCPTCGRSYAPFPGTEDSELIDWEVRVTRQVHHRVRYKRSCDCPEVAGIVTASGPTKLIPKGMFTTRFWVQLMLEKYLFQRPLNRVRRMLELEGLEVSLGTLTGGLKYLGRYVQPLYAKILEHSRSAEHWHMDETRWMVFEEVKGKKNHRWWLWVVITKDTCVYLLDPSRSAEVPRNHLGPEATGVINADRYSAYKTLANILIAFCWTHVRRDFVKVRDGYARLRLWGQSWVESIGRLFDLNAKRLSVRDQPESFAASDHELREVLDQLAQKREEQLADSNLHPAQRKPLESLRKHWDGLLLFVDDPDIPMDNSIAERLMRDPVLGRKSYYGSGSVWSGALSAALFTIFQTLRLNHIDPKQFLIAYFHTCAENGGQVPSDLDRWLPQNLEEARKAAWAHPRARAP